MTWGTIRYLAAVGLAIGLLHSPGMARADFLPAQHRTSPPVGAHTLCQTYSWACAHSGGAAPLTQAHVAAAARVNTGINRQVTEIADDHQYGQVEVWTLPTARGGDCEDFALLKKRQLIAQGFAPEHLLIATALDTRRQAHAVLILRTGAGDYVLDNLTDAIRHWRDTGYTFLRIQDPAAPQSWSAVLAGGIVGDGATGAAN